MERKYNEKRGGFMNFDSYVPANISKYLDGFNRKKYAQIMKAYLDDCQSFFAELEHCEDVDTAAKELVDRIDSRVTGLFKKRQFCDIQYFLLAYAAPAALQQNTEKTIAFSEATRNAWIARHPDMPYECTTIEKLSSGFSNSILGFPIGGRK